MFFKKRKKVCQGFPGHTCTAPTAPVQTEIVRCEKGTGFIDKVVKSFLEIPICLHCLDCWAAAIQDEVGVETRVWIGNKFADILYEQEDETIGQWSNTLVRAANGQFSRPVCHG